MIKKYKKGDEVIVKVGKDKGKTGTISKVINSSDKIVISGVNVSKKHQKASQDSKGGIIDKEMPIHISNVLAYDSKNKKPFDDFPKNSEDIIKFLDNLNWQKPWAAGAQFAALCVFAKTQLSDNDFKNTSKVLLDYIDEKADIKTGCYFDKPQPDENEMINGAMKVLTGLDWLDARIHNPEQLIDFCLNSSPSHDGCDIVDTVYVLYRTTKETDYKSDDINEYLIKIIDVIEKHYFYGIGGFSYFVNKSQTKYYGANIADGKNEPDIHGTTLLIWALSMILEITGDSLLNWKVIKP